MPHRMGVRGVFLGLVTLALLPHAADAQSMPVSGFVGFGLTFGSNDGRNRVRFPEPGFAPIWDVEAAVPISERVAVGAELTRFGEVTGGTQGISWRLTEEESETAFAALLRVRAARAGRAAFDLVAGGGFVSANTNSTQRTCDVIGGAQQCVDYGDYANRRSPAFTLGGDLSIGLARHVALAGVVRLLNLKREPVDSNFAHQAPSSRLNAGVRLRVGW